MSTRGVPGGGARSGARGVQGTREREVGAFFIDLGALDDRARREDHAAIMREHLDHRPVELLRE